MALLGVCHSSSAQSVSSYVKTVKYLGEGRADSIVSVQFHDGLGRPSVSATNGLAGDGVFTYSMKAYDAKGRNNHDWYPVAGGSTIACPTADEFASMSGNLYSDDYAFTTNTYDAMDRVVTVSRGGSAWVQANKVARNAYKTNSASDVKRYHIGISSVAQNGYWPAGSLTAETFYDEDNHAITIYKDLLGNVIMEKKAGTQTYYVYNDRDLLVYVLTPLYQSNSSINDCAYVYSYDDRNRVVSKKLPGCGTTQYTYDSADRIVTESNPLLAEKGLIRFFVYDAFGRPCIQGTCSSYSPLSENPIAKRTSGNNGILQTGYSADINVVNAQIEVVNYYDDYSFFADTLFDGYTNSSSMHSNASSNELAFSCRGAKTAEVVAASNGMLLFSTYFYDSRGRCIEEKHSDISGNINKVITTYSHTDKPTSVTKTIHISQQQPVFTTGEARASGNTEFSISSLYTYNPHNDMLETESVQCGNNAPIVVSHLTYDGAGRVHQDERTEIADVITYDYDLHGWTDSIASNYFTEHLYYANGPITKNPSWNGNISSMIWQASDGIGRGYYYKYNDRNMLFEAGYRSSNDNYEDNASESDRYNEVVSAFTLDGAIESFRRRGKVGNSYTYIDKLNYAYNGQQVKSINDEVTGRLSIINSFEYINNHNGSLSNPDFTYNSAGMLTKDLDKQISRISYNNIGLTDSIQFSTSANVAYTYAMNGEKLKVEHRAASRNMASADILASGITPGVPTPIVNTSTKEYILGNIEKEYEGMTIGSTYRYYFGNGYVKFSDGFATLNPQYFFYTKDHLGNVRSVVTKNHSTNEITEVQQTHYYPFGGIIADLGTGRSVQNHLYNGKELDTSNNLWWYDYGARQYDPTRGQFTTPDPSSEKYYPTNYFTYCSNNPTNAIDPDGNAEVLVRAAVGAFVGGAIYGLKSYFIDGHSGRQLGGDILEGAIIGGFAGVTLNINAVGSMASRLLQNTGIGFISGGVSSGVGDAANQLYTTGDINVNQSVQKAATGAAVGAVTGLAGGVIDETAGFFSANVKADGEAAKASAKTRIIDQNQSPKTAPGQGTRFQNRQLKKTTKEIDDVVKTEQHIIIASGKQANFAQQLAVGFSAPTEYEFPIQFGQ